jgi:hypothetical protein
MTGSKLVMKPTQLQREDTKAFAKSRADLLKCLAAKGAATRQTGTA